MNAVVTPVSVQRQSQEPMIVLIVGKIVGSDLFEGMRYTRVMTPSADAYSKPQMVKARSKQQLGARDEEVRFTGRLCGSGRFYDRTDKQTGDVTRVQDVSMWVEVIE